MATVPREERPRSTLALLRHLLASLTNVVEDSADLVSASIREELQRFRMEAARHALSVVALVAGASLLSAGLAIFLSELLGSWALTLALFGVAYLALGFALQRMSGPEGDAK